MKLWTKNGRDFFEVASLLQKSLRRGDVVMAARAVNELFPKYANYCWNRLMTVSAEDCADFVTGEIVALYDAWTKVNKTSSDNAKGRIFFAKAIVILARAKHSRDADELHLLVVDRMPDEEFNKAVAEVEVCVDEADASWNGEIPAWVYDVHTRKGKAMGKTKAEFIQEEHDALVNPQTIFANLDEMIASAGYVKPEFDFGES